MARRGDKPVPAAVSAGAGVIRLDKWIWFARFLRTRAACADLVRGGHVRLNGRKVTQPGTDIRIGEVLTLALPGRTLVVEVAALAARRGDAPAARALYRPIEPDHREGLKNE